METTTDVPPPPSPGPPPAGAYRPPLVRRRSNWKIAGVAGALATHLGVDPLVIRIAFVALTLSGGLGLLLYLIGWVFIPEEGEEASVGDGLLGRLRRAPSWMPIALVVVAGLVLLGRGWGGSIFWALVLIGGGVWLYHNDTHRPAPSPKGGGAGARPGQAPAWIPPPVPPVSGVSSADAPPARPSWPAYPYRPTPPPPPPRPRRPRSLLGRYTLAALLVVLGLTAAADNVGALHVGARVYPALALLVVGGGLVIGAFWGRSRMLILLGLLILPVAFVASLVRVPLEGGAGQRIYVPQTVESVRSEYRLGAGQIRLDLTHLQWGSSPVETHATVAAGNIEVIVAPEVTVELRGHTGAGEINLFSQRRSGFDVTFQSVAEGTQAGGPRLVIDADVSLGTIDIIRSGRQGGASQ